MDENYRRRVGSHACAGKAYLSQPGFLAHDDGRLGLEISPEKYLPLKGAKQSENKTKSDGNFELKNGTLKPHEEIPAGTSTKWDTYQLVTGVDNVDKVMRYKNRSSESGRSENDQMLWATIPILKAQKHCMIRILLMIPYQTTVVRQKP